MGPLAGPIPAAMDLIVSFSDKLNGIVLRLCGAMVAVLLAINVYGVFFRYALNDPLPWPLPVSRILLVWIALLGISVALKAGEHVAVEGVVRSLPAQYEKTIRLAGYAATGIWLAVVLWQGWLATVAADQMMMISAKLQISFKWRLAAVPASAAVQLVHILACPAIIQAAMEQRAEELP
ncbi:TRAP transporter small permease [Desulfatiglans anilini]|uniref:TRAP transporter small permease n=1 Tax=Desulfatiglans anilini TaxID=90728 RepID=UPI0003FA6401|nr:TRAP transporter small permease subunit [Desulfatiglans anilini]